MGNGNTFVYGEKSSYASLQSSNTAYEQSTEAINIKPTPGTATEIAWLSAEVSYFFVSFSVGKLETKDSHIGKLVDTGNCQCFVCV